MRGIIAYKEDLILTSFRVLSVITFASLTALGAQIRVPLPFTPVPITLQVLPVLVSGVALGRNLGFLSQMLYVLLGLFGLPVFAGARGGLEVLKGYTGGYLIGFVFASYLIGWLQEKKSTTLTARLAVGATLLLILFCALGFLEMARIDLKTFSGLIVAIAGVASSIIILVRFRSESAAIFNCMVIGLVVIYLCGTFQLACVADLSLSQASLQGIIPFVVGDLLKTSAGLGLLKLGRLLSKEIPETKDKSP